MELTNKMANPVALITGGSRGIGRATALRLAQDGFDIAFCYASDSSAAQEVEKDLTGLGCNVYVRRADVSTAAEVRTLVAGAEDALGPITALVASAAIVRDTPLALMEDEDWDTVLRVNLDGVYHVCRAVIDEMMARRHGAIVTLSSLAGLRGNAGQTSYAASKAAIIGFTKSLAQEVGPYGIRANVVAPGVINTDQITRLPESFHERAMQQIALRRYGRPEEVADLISFLLSERAEYITGSVLHIDGGFQ
jgi:3-oxoacyl-[acyl-carrier protein] reductase